MRPFVVRKKVQTESIATQLSDFPEMRAIEFFHLACSYIPANRRFLTNSRRYGRAFSLRVGTIEGPVLQCSPRQS